MSVSNSYLEDLKALHTKKSFGKGGKILKVVHELIKERNISSLLDFGCGKGGASQSFREQYPDIELYSYDPATSPIELPEHVDLVYSSDVLEHVEPELLQETLIDLKNRSTYMYHLIACHPAKKKLRDGRNAHLIIENPSWWRKELEKAGLNIVYEDIVEYTARPKKGNSIAVTKYIVITAPKN